MNSPLFYLSLKSLHVVGVISWMAGLLYFYRLFVYHFEFGQKDRSIHTLLSLMEKRLFRFITVPALAISVFSGLWMVYLNPLLMSEKWFQVKIVAACLMITMTFHGMIPLSRFQRQQFEGYSSTWLRVMNEIPTLLMVLIVIMVFLRPV